MTREQHLQAFGAASSDEQKAINLREATLLLYKAEQDPTKATQLRDAAHNYLDAQLDAARRAFHHIHEAMRLVG